MSISKTSGPIGILDSGIGGLSVLRHIRALLPHEQLLYFADQTHIPYGSRSLDEIYNYSTAIIKFLLDHQAKLIVVACNTASAAALDALRQTFSGLPIVGMEPAVKPAATQTRSGKVGVLATPGTFRSQRYASLMARYGQSIDVFEDPCSGLVELIESGAIAAPETEQLLRRIVEPMLQAGVDTLVLGCTHYPFVLPQLRSIADDTVAIIDPAPAVARQTKNVLQHYHIGAPVSQQGTLRCYTTGDPLQMENLATHCGRLLDQSCEMHAAIWEGNSLIAQQ
jgi:glutamate racemase